MTKIKKVYIFPILALAVANIMWGLNTVLIKVTLETMPVSINVGVRFLIASLCLLPFAIKAWRPLKRSDLLRFILSSIFTITLSVSALSIGLSKTPAFNAAAIWLLGPVLLLLLSASFLKEKISFRTFIGVLIAILGSIIIIGRPPAGSNMEEALVGNLFLLLAVVFNVIAVLISKPLMKKAGSYQATFLTLFPGSVPVVIYSLTELSSWDMSSVSNAGLQAFFISIVFAAVANVLFYYALRRKEAHSTGVYSYLDPAVTVIAAWFILAERPNSGFIVGAALILVGLYLAELHSKHMHHLLRRHKA